MSSTVCSRCAATALRFTPRRTRPANDNKVFISIHQVVSISFSIQKNPRRFASSSSKPSTSSLVNPPVSTLPAELDLPPASTSTADEALSEKLSRYFKIGRAYLNFYKIGLKNVYFNWKASLPLRRTLGLPVYLPTPVPPPATRASKQPSFNTLLETLQISRSDFQLLRRAAYDARLAIPFGITALICGEFTPLLVYWIGDQFSPYTCRFPRLLNKRRDHMVRDKRKAFAYAQAQKGSVAPIQPGSEEEMTLLTKFASREHASTVPRAERTFVFMCFGIPGIIRTRSKMLRWMDYLDLDDRLIVKSGGVNALSAKELRIAIDERGGVDFGSPCLQSGSMEEEREWLSEWLRRRGI